MDYGFLQSRNRDEHDIINIVPLYIFFKLVFLMSTYFPGATSDGTIFFVQPCSGGSLVDLKVDLVLALFRF